MAGFTQINAGQTPTVRASIKSGDVWFDKDSDLATQAELNTEFADATTIPYPVSLTVYKSTNVLSSQEFKRSKSTACTGFTNLNVSTGALIEADTVEDSELDYNFSHTLDTRASNPFDASGVYWLVYKIYPKTGAPIVIVAGVEVR